MPSQADVEHVGKQAQREHGDEPEIRLDEVLVPEDVPLSDQLDQRIDGGHPEDHPDQQPNRTGHGPVGPHLVPVVCGLHAVAPFDASAPPMSHRYLPSGCRWSASRGWSAVGWLASSPIHWPWSILLPRCSAFLASRLWTAPGGSITQTGQWQGKIQAPGNAWCLPTWCQEATVLAYGSSPSSRARPTAWVRLATPSLS